MSSAIDAMLYRPLRSGNEYNGLIPAYKGTQYNFDKESDNSTTYDTLKYMAQWSNKYAYQMKQIAPLLKGRTIQETVNKIYQFLYSHFQYKLDGSLQNLYSPSAAWHFRQQGFDCKTYSLLASTILQNLNITHSFRMVQQAGIMPGEWSHVYVVIPDNNTEYVIDATTHTNKQVSFTKKHDYVMKHLGLAAPYTPNYGLGCACSGNKITRNKGLGAPANLSNTIANFHLFLNELEKKGIPKANLDKMLELVRYNVENGIDPNMNEIVQKAFQPAGKLGEITPVSLLSSYGTTYSTQPIASPVAIQGTSLDSIVGGATSLLTGNPLGIIGLITSLIPFDKTFGAVFANGFDLSCWGSTVTPSMAKGWGEKDFPMVLNETLAKSINLQNLNMYLDAMNHLESMARDWGSRMRSCSQKGLYNYANAAKTAKEGVLEGVRAALAQQGIQMIPIASITTTKAKTPFTFQSSVFTNEYVPYKVERFNIIMPAVQPTQATPVPQIAYTATGTAVTPSQQIANPTQQYYDASGQPLANNDATPKKSSSMTTPLLVGGALLALKLLI
jgi:hypothetical protein